MYKLLFVAKLHLGGVKGLEVSMKVQAIIIHTDETLGIVSQII
jgi:hypothetical protein